MFDFLDSNKSSCAGDFQAGTRAGKGIMLLPDGGVYTGEFAADKWEGTGMYEYPDGSCYVGGWQQGKKHGSGADGSTCSHSSRTNVSSAGSQFSRCLVCRHILGQARWLPCWHLGCRNCDRHCILQAPCLLYARLIHKRNSGRQLHVREHCLPQARCVLASCLRSEHPVACWTCTDSHWHILYSGGSCKGS